jgi:hypothetical protein
LNGEALFLIKPDHITASFAQEKDVDKILELNRLEYGLSDILTTPEDFAWRCDQNPAGQAIIPVIRNNHDEVVGFIWIVPLRIRVEGQDYLAATGTNLFIRPEYRNTFGYTKLIRGFEQVFLDKEIPLHFSFVSEQTYRQVQTHHPQTVFTVPLLIKPLNIKSLAQTYFTTGWLRFMMGQVGRVASPFIFRQPSMSTSEKITIQAVDQFDEEFDNFWEQVQNKYPVMAIRDQAFLAWRFAKISGRRYHILVARVGDRMLGYTVVRCATIRGVKTGLIMDFLVADDTLGEVAGAHLMAEAEAYFHTQEMAVATGLMVPFASEYQILRQAGYIRLPQILALRAFRFAFFIHNTPEKDLISLSAQDWFITMADYESF